MNLKFLLLAVILGSLSLFACSDDDDYTPDQTLRESLKPNIRMLPGSPGRKKASTVWSNSGLTTKKHTPGLTHPENGI